MLLFQSLIAPASDEAGCPVPSRSIVVQASCRSYQHAKPVMQSNCNPAACDSQEAMCNAVVEQLMAAIEDRDKAFLRNHPGGAIGRSRRDSVN